MGQQELIKTLEKNQKRMTSNELMEETGLSKSAVNTSLRKLIKYKEIKMRKKNCGSYIAYTYWL